MAGHLSFPLIFSDVGGGGSGLPPGGTDGQILLSDGAGSGTWADGAVGRTKVVSVPFAFDTPDLLTGAVIYTPTVGELLLDGWIEIVTAWDGTTPLADIGTFLNGSASGLFRRADSAIPADAIDDDTDNPGILVGTNSSAYSLAEKSVYGDIQRSAPAKFTVANPLCVIVTQEGTPGGTSPGAGQGAAIVHLVIWSPDEVGGVTGGLSITDGSTTVSPVTSLTVTGATVTGSAGNATIAGFVPSSNYITIPGALESTSLVVNPGGVGKTFYSSHELTSVGEGAFTYVNQDYSALTHTFKTGVAGGVDALVLADDGAATFADSVTADAFVGLAWDAAVTYPVGAVVVDRGGIWQCLIANTNSQPISGNVNWRLIGGWPYVDVTVDPVAQRTAPYADPTSSGPGLVIIPAPGAGYFLALNSQVVVQSSSGDGTPGSSNGTSFGFGDATQIISNTGDGSLDSGMLYEIPDIATSGTYTPAQYGDTPIVIWTTDALGAGSRSLLLRVHYTICPLPPASPLFFTIIALDQGSKTFTVGVDAHTLTGSVAVVGSTGNDATYSVVSATYTAATPRAITVADTGANTFTVAGDRAAEFPVGTTATVAGSTGNDGAYTVISAVFGSDTVITISSFVPSAIADGTIHGPSSTAIVVVEAIASATADGWVKQ